ncbi:MAG: phosphate signaling complex protein PhoU, partial [Gammaproteobacteria bacterium]|nr:phosphate signaling complex protein PhoU [Gammaproteobacteria bacterium]
METGEFGQHISQQFNDELEDIRNRVLTMGGLVEKQLADAINSMVEGDTELAESVVANDHRVNGMEVSIDEECSRVLARRQPAAGDLRLVVAVIKTITDLERIGDQAERVARFSLRLAENSHHGYFKELEHLAEDVRQILNDALDAFARMDPEAALEVARSDISIDQEYDSIMRQLITFMMEDPRNVTRVLDVMWTARALERIGDHAKNICEYVIYLVKGKDVRHISIDKMEEAVNPD